MSRADLLARWRQRRDDFDRLTAAVEARALIDQLLAELELLFAEEEEHALTLTEAARESGFRRITWHAWCARAPFRTPGGRTHLESDGKTFPGRPRPCPAGALPFTLQVPHLSRSRGPS